MQFGRMIVLEQLQTKGQIPATFNSLISPIKVQPSTQEIVHSRNYRQWKRFCHQGRKTVPRKSLFVYVYLFAAFSFNRARYF